MRRNLAVLLLVLGMCGPAAAQAPAPSQDYAALRAFGDALNRTRNLFIQAVPTRTLILRAIDGLAVNPAFAKPTVQATINAAKADAAARSPDDVVSLLRTFGDLVDKLHAGSDGMAMDAILRIATAGMLDGLDTQTGFMPPEPAADSAGTASIGVGFRSGPDGAQVVHAYPQGPAASAGIARGDTIVAVDGHSTKGLPLAQILTLLRGPAGTTVSVTFRHGVADPRTVALTRSAIRVAPVGARIMNGAAYIAIETFAPGVGQGIRKLLSDLPSRIGAPLRGIVLDLRDNEGGRWNEVFAVASDFLPPDTLIATTSGRVAADDKRLTAAGGDAAAGLPLVILVNDHTASGAEVLAAALQAGRGAVLMGSNTAGAGALATVIPIPPLGMMRLTTQRVILANGQILQPPGLLPQVALAPRADALPQEAPNPDPIVLRLRRGLTQVPPPGLPFDLPDTPERDFEVRQALEALSIMPARAAATP